MAGNLSNYAEQKILELSVGKTAWTNTAVWIALYTATPTETSGPADSEVSHASYHRVAVSTASGSVFGAATGGGSITNNGTYSNLDGSASAVTSSGNGQITFPTAGASWGTVTHVALVDSASGTGNIIWYGALTSTKTVDNGDIFQFAPSSLTLSLD